MEVKRMTAQSLVIRLRSQCEETQKEAVCELRLLAKWDTDNRICIAEAGAIPLLLDLLYSSDAKLQENAITALLNLSIYPENRERIMGTRAGLDAIVHVLKGGGSLEAKQNASATIFSLLVVENYRSIVGDRPDVTRGLLDLIRQGSPRCTKDALKALFHMALYPLNRSKLVSEGVVPVLFSLLMNAATGVIEDATAVIAQVAGCGESVAAFRRVLGVQVLLDLLDSGSPRARENAASALLNLARSGGDRVVDDILDVDSSMLVISDLLSTGTPRAKSKVSALLEILLVHERRHYSATF